MNTKWYGEGSGETPSSKPAELTKASTDTDGDNKRTKPNSSAKATSSWRPSFREKKEKTPFNRGTLIGIKDVDNPTGADMCKDAMKALRKEGRKKIIVDIAVSESEIKLKKEDDSETRYSFEDMSYVWRHPKKHQLFGYVYGTLDNKHLFVAFEVPQELAKTFLGPILRAFQAVNRRIARDIGRPIIRQEDSASTGSGDSGTGNHTEARMAILESQIAQQTEMMAKLLAEMNRPTKTPENNASLVDFYENSPVSSHSSSVSHQSRSDDAPTNWSSIPPDSFEPVAYHQDLSFAGSSRTNQQTSCPQDPDLATLSTSAPISGTGSSYLDGDLWWLPPPEGSSVFDLQPPVLQPPEVKIVDQSMFRECVEGQLQDLGTESELLDNFMKQRNEKPSNGSFPHAPKKSTRGSVAAPPGTITFDTSHVIPPTGARHMPLSTEPTLMAPIVPTTAPPLKPVLPPRPSIRKSLDATVDPWIGNYEEDTFCIRKAAPEALENVTCAGCKVAFSTPGETPDLSLVLVRKEQDYVTGPGQQKEISDKEEKYYHMFTSCVKRRHPSFHPRTKGLVVVNGRWYIRASPEEKRLVDLFKDGDLY